MHKTANKDRCMDLGVDKYVTEYCYRNIRKECHANQEPAVSTLVAAIAIAISSQRGDGAAMV